jgi:hypothetical protein
MWSKGKFPCFGNARMIDDWVDFQIFEAGFIGYETST